MEYALAAYYVICTSEASSNLARFDGVRYGPAVDTKKSWHAAYQDIRKQGFGTEVRRRIMLRDLCTLVGVLREVLRKGTDCTGECQEGFCPAFC